LSRFARLFLLCVPSALGMGHCFAGPITSPKGYTLTSPQGWRTDASGRTGNDLVVFTLDPADKFTPNLNVRLGQAGPHDTLESAKVFFNKSYPARFPHWKPVSQGFSAIGSRRALDTTATVFIGSPGRLMRMRQALVIRGRMLFFFTCVSPEEAHAKYDKAFNDILRSVRWTTGG